MQKILSRRVLRDIRQNLPRYAALFFLVLLSMYLVVSLVGAAESIIRGAAQSSEEHFVEDPGGKGCDGRLYPNFIANVAIGMELEFSPMLYLGIYAGVLVCYLVIDLLLVRKLDKMTPAEVLKNRE